VIVIELCFNSIAALIVNLFCFSYNGSFNPLKVWF